MRIEQQVACLYCQIISESSSSNISASDTQAPVNPNILTKHMCIVRVIVFLTQSLSTHVMPIIHWIHEGTNLLGLSDMQV